MHAATVVNKGRKDDGVYGVQEMEGERVHQASGGVAVMHLPAASVGKNKLDAR